MPKATLSFSLPEERDEFYSAENGGLFRLVVYELDQFLRQKLKHEQLTEKEDEIYQALRDKLNEFMSDYDLKY